jgi:amino acid permease
MILKLVNMWPSRQVMSMIAIGGCIGTGLFMTSGGAIHSAGALGALIAYAIIGAMVFFLMTSLGEMATILYDLRGNCYICSYSNNPVKPIIPS